MNQLKIGAILSYVSVIITILIALLYTPIMIRLLGQSEYGLYSMIGSLSAYLSIMDLGLGNAIIRFTARNRVIGDKNTESNLNGMFLIIYTLIGLLTVIVGTVIFNTIDNVFGQNLTPSEIEKAKIMVIILIINFALSFPLSIFGSIIQAYERFVIVKVVAIIRSLSIPLVTLPFLFFNFGSITMVVVSTVINILCLLFNVYYCLKKLKVSFYFGKMDFQVLKEIIGYSFFIFLGIIVDQVNWNTGQIILGSIKGTSMVAIFAIAIQFIKLYLQFSTSLSGLFLPKISMMVANNSSNESLTAFLVKYSRIQYIIMAFILTGFILFGYQFIGIWAGSNYVSAYYMVLLIMIPITIPLIQNICLSILQAKNMQGFRSIILILIAIFNVIISIPLSKIYGGIGTAFGTGISYLIGNALIMNIFYHRKIGLNIILFWKNIFHISLPVFIALIIGFGINSLLQFNLFINIVLYSIIYFILVWFMGLNNYEKNLVHQLTRKFKPKYNT
ncbi:oligosaccharide flippase family protein [Niallia sp. FSL K6-0212]|uniref:oligosaccharide flippase family protein n=1 Tax=Niallia sp. FSL K6-0212 TaxID=2921423 RepID=UPI0030FA3F65